MKWNPDTGEFEVEREDGKRKREQPTETPSTKHGIKPHAPVRPSTPRPKNPSPNVDDLYKLLDDMPEHLEFDIEAFPRTIPEAEARVLSVLVFQCIAGEDVHQWVNYGYWTEPQQRRFRKAEVAVAHRLIRMALRKHPVPLGDADDGAAD